MAQYYASDEERNRAIQQGRYRPQTLSYQAQPGSAYAPTTASPSNPPRATTPAPQRTTAPTYGTQPQPRQRYGTDTFESFRLANQQGSPEEILRRAYKQWTGRDADEAGLRAHMSNPGGLTGGARAIYDSAESQAYRQSNPQGWAGQTPPSSRNNTGINGAGAVQPSVYTGYTPKYAMEGFNFGREQNTGKSAKDAFAFLANQAPPPPINNKEALGQWFKQYIEPGMNQLGHKVLSVEGDKFRFSNWQGTFDVDFGRGAGAEGGALAWQVDDQTAVMPTNPVYTPLSPDTAPTTEASTYNTPPQTQLTMPDGTPAIVDEQGQLRPANYRAPMSSTLRYRRQYQPTTSANITAAPPTI